MRVVGVIAEYNPFHAGHLYQLQEIRRRFAAESVIIAMSGDFVQRGEPAIYDKYTRTEIALRAGADLVLELPVCFATGSAEDFAAAGTALLDHLGIVDGLCFGSEAGDLDLLIKAADILLTESPAYKEILQKRLKSGDTYPRAQAQALTAALTSGEYADARINQDPSILSKLISDAPNNILGIEYLKALRRRDSSIIPLTIRRSGQNYHETDLFHARGFPSASAIRRALAFDDLDYIDYIRDVIQDQLPCFTETERFSVFEKRSKRTIEPTPVFADDLTAILNAKLLEVSANQTDLAGFIDFTPELASRLSHQILDFTSFGGRVEQLKTKNYTYARVSRALLHLLLGMTKDFAALAREMDYTPYIRILGFRQSSTPLLTDLRRSCHLPLITKTADARKLLDTDGLKIFEKDLFASHLYQSIVFAKKGTRMPNEYTRSVIIV